MLFTERDDGAGAPVVVINQAMAKRFWPKADPLSDKIWIGKGIMTELAAETPRQIIGIVGDVRGGLDNDPGPTMYVPNAQVPDALNALNVRITPLKWVVRTRVNAFTLSSAIQEQLRQASGLPVSDVRTMDEVVSRSTSRQRFNMLLMTVFGAAALFLASLGVYGLMAYSVQQRTQEIGIRMALGAGSGHVLKMVVGQGMCLALVGVAIGVASALGLSRLLATFLVRREAEGSRGLHRCAVDPDARILDRRVASGSPRRPCGPLDRLANRVNASHRPNVCKNANSSTSLTV